MKSWIISVLLRAARALGWRELPIFQGPKEPDKKAPTQPPEPPKTKAGPPPTGPR